MSVARSAKPAGAEPRVALRCHGVGKRFGQGEASEEVLREVSLTVPAGEACCLLGPSGSGKTTLLSILGCLLTPTTGELAVDGVVVDFSRSGQLADLRRRRIGFVFQHAHLLPFLSVERNLMAVAENAGLSATGAARRSGELLEQLGMAKSQRKLPSELSGGQRQRVAVARALLHQPAVVLADEPTAALDWEHARMVMELLITQTRRERSALIVVTHDTRLIEFVDRVLKMDGGRLINV